MTDRALIAVWEVDGVEIKEPVTIPLPPSEPSAIATKRWMASRGLARWSEAEEQQYWDEFDTRNPMTAYRRQQEELREVHHGRFGDVDDYVCLEPKPEGRTSDGARFVRFEMPPDEDEVIR